MLQLVLGVAGAGKSAYLLQQMEQRAAAGQKSIFLVPEQFSSSSEAQVYNLLGDEKSALVEVASFRTMAERILKLAGADEKHLLTDAGRMVYVRRAMDSLGDTLHVFVRQRRRAAFCAMCADAISELKSAGAMPEVLYGMGQKEETARLEELALIYAAYDELVKKHAMDEQDRLALAAEHAGEVYFENRACFINHFDGFTTPEYQLLEQVLKFCEIFAVSLCCDGLNETDGGLGVFSPVRATAARLVALAQKTGVQVKAPIEKQAPTTALLQGPQAVNNLLAFEEEPEDLDALTGLTLTEYADEWDEVRAAAAEMHRLARQGVSYSKMALVCRNMAHYEVPVRRAFALFAIPYFIDAPATTEYTAPVVFILSALRLLRQGLVSEPILAMAKTGMLGHTDAELAALENYVFTWEPKAAEWKKPFDKNPAGLMQPVTAKSDEALHMAEKVRSTLVPLLEGFVKKAKGADAAALSRQLYLLLDKAEAAKHDEQNKAGIAAQDGGVMAEEARRAWDLAMDLLDQMTQLLGAENVSAMEYEELFLLLVRGTDFGQVPQVQESVVFASADRMRLDKIEYCFVVGLCEGEFPAEQGESGLLTAEDRDKLAAQGVELGGNFESRTLLEEMFFYRALTSAGSGLYLSWPAHMGGTTKSATGALEPIRLVLQPPALQTKLQDAAATPGAAFDRLAYVYREDTQEAATLHGALSQQEDAVQRLQMLHHVDNRAAFTVQDHQTLHTVLGSSLTLSATRAERYYECHFAYYMERILNVQERRKGTFSPMESGTFIHYLLEKVLKECGAGFKDAEDEQLAQLAAKYAESFIAEMLPESSRRTDFLLNQMSTGAAQLLCYLRDDAKQSGFEPDALELSLAEEEGIQPLCLTAPGGQTVKITGKIDRVDVMHSGDKTYLRVIDYKTGTRKFSLDDVYCGLNMQMLIYMDTLCQNAPQRYPNAIPAAVLYLAGDPAPTTGQRMADTAPVYELDGLVLDDPSVLRALDAEGAGVFLPLKHKDGKPVRAGKKLASLAKMGQLGRHVEGKLEEMVQGLYQGQFSALPLVSTKKRPCDYCPYRAACRHENGRNEVAVRMPEDAFDTEGGEDNA